MRQRLILSFILVVLVSISGVVWFARQNAARDVRTFMIRGGMVGAEELVTRLADYYRANGSWSGVERLLAMQGQGRGWGMGGMMQGQGMMMNQRLRLADAQGNVLVDTSRPAVLGRLSSLERSAALPVQVDGRTVGYFLAEGGMEGNRANENMLLNRLTLSAITAGLLSGGLALLLALYLAYRLLAPVRALTQAARRLGQGDLSQRVQVVGNDELAVLAQTFNRMADSLQQAEVSRRAMTADIAHELRNPLAVQRAHLEALQDGVYPLTADHLEPVLSQNLLLSRLVDDLRTLALADSGQLRLECAPTDLAALLEGLVERFKPQADGQQVQLLVELPPANQALPPLMLDPQRVEQIISNLLSNALRYTPPGGSIQLALARAGTQARLSVHDSGPGIPAEALGHVFERFYRADRARSRDAGGSGLGLAIARQLAEAHGGSLTAANHPHGGAVFTLTLPLSQASAAPQNETRDVTRSLL